MQGICRARGAVGVLPNSRRRQFRDLNGGGATCRLFSVGLFASSGRMWKCLVLGGWLAVTAVAQVQNPQVEIANLREDVRGLAQRMGALALRVEQLERENSELRERLSAADRSAVTMSQLRESLADLDGRIRTAAAGAKAEALQQVGVQMEKLAKQTNAALDALAKAQATRPTVQTTFAEEYPKEGISYTVQKGDSLASIAKKTGAKQQDIINANKLADPSKITIGQTLFIPGGK